MEDSKEVAGLADEISGLERENAVLWSKLVDCRKALSTMEAELKSYRMAYGELRHECSVLARAARDLTDEDLQVATETAEIAIRERDEARGMIRVLTRVLQDMKALTGDE